MCGITGFYSKENSEAHIIKVIEEMNKLQIHRGPNNTDKFLNKDKNLGLMACRLSIIDIERGNQPMKSNDGRYTLIFNGAILNSPELRKEMEKKGINFFSKNSDTEVLLNLLILQGIKCLKILNGFFSFAFYDNKTKKLLCARDRFGIKPFYYLYNNKELLFASELKSILNSGYSSKDIDKQSLYHYLSLLWVPGPNTIIKDIKKLQPGHLLELDLSDNILQIIKWWDLDFKPDYSVKKSEWPKKILSALTNSVKRSTLSDVPLSCALSGGLDSQSITGILSSINKKPTTFTLSYEGNKSGDLNELNSSKIAAKYFETNHKEILLNSNDYFSELNKMVYHLDEPYGGGLPLWHVLKEAGKNYGVILTGLGGDELFGNYGRWSVLEKFFFLIFKSKMLFKKLFFDRKYFFTDELKNKLIIREKENFNKTNDYLYNFIWWNFEIPLCSRRN